ncbi:MAG TPA: acireductone synthase, partial [Myxococcales bacterium]|nr:acireductone synthase [Myxococcales bacterium]
MIEAVLTDIEGTAGPISFVREVLFPWARGRLRGHVAAHRQERAVAEILDGARRMMGAPDAPDEEAIAALERWSDEDRKVAPLKALQGLVWEDGYRSGELRGRLYPDVAPALRAWSARGLRLFVFSSGSAHAQRLYFGCSEDGDLRPLFQGFFDTTTGAKVEPASYQAIAQAIGLPPARVLFLSDTAAELDAAARAGMHAVALAREGPAAVGPHPTARSFEEIHVGAGAPWVTGRGGAARARELAALGRQAAARGWAL